MKEFIANAWKNACKWIKKNAVLIVGGIATIIGFILGRKSLGGNNANIEKLRNDNEQLVKQSEALRRELDRLRELSKDDKQRLGDIEEELSRARESLDSLRYVASGTGQDVDELEANNQRLRDWIAKYSKEIAVLADSK